MMYRVPPLHTTPVALLAFLTVLVGAATPVQAGALMALSWLTTISPGPKPVDRFHRKVRK
jgi:hypothetical protein